MLYGVDEGSQRSALTLVLRVLSLVVHIRQERTLWTAGLGQVAQVIMTVAPEKDIEAVRPDDRPSDHNLGAVSAVALPPTLSTLPAQGWIEPLKPGLARCFPFVKPPSHLRCR